MDLAKGFAKNGKCQYIEGYISTETEFNGVLFLLKEPNTDDQRGFWFKECFYHDYDQICAKRTFTRYKTVFNKLLTYSESGLKLKNCAYANIKSYNGKNRESSEYRKLSYAEKLNRLDSLIDACHPKFIFICQDLFDTLIMINKISPLYNGVTYKGGSIQKRKCYYKSIPVYEIYHPSYWRIGYPDEREI